MQRHYNTPEEYFYINIVFKTNYTEKPDFDFLKIGNVNKI